MGPLSEVRGPRITPVILAAVVATLASGCTTAIPIRTQGEVAGHQGGSWEVVLPGGETAPSVFDGPEYARLDESLNDEPWTEPYRPSLDQVGRLFLPRRANQVLYFRTGYYPPRPPRFYGPTFLGPTYIGRPFTPSFYP